MFLSIYQGFSHFRWPWNLGHGNILIQKRAIHQIINRKTTKNAL